MVDNRLEISKLLESRLGLEEVSPDDVVVAHQPPRPPVYYLHLLYPIAKQSNKVFYFVSLGEDTIIDSVATLLKTHLNTREKSLVKGSISVGGINGESVKYLIVTHEETRENRYQYDTPFFSDSDFEDKRELFYRYLETVAPHSEGDGKFYDRCVTLGTLAILSEAVIWQILKYLSGRELSIIATVSRGLKLLSEIDSVLWRRLAKRDFQFDIPFQGTWKRSYLSHRKTNIPQRETAASTTKWFYCGDLPEDSWKNDQLPSLQHSGFQALLRYIKREWARSQINPWVDFNLPDSVSGIDRIAADDVTEELIREYDRRSVPFIISNGTASWAAMEKWTEASLLKSYSDNHFRARGLKISLNNYISYTSAQHDERPLYLFDDTTFEELPELLKDYEVPSYFKQDYFSSLEEDMRPPYRWFSIGPPRSGARFHCDPWHTSAWNALVSGYKRWSLYPPGIAPPGPKVSQPTTVLLTLTTIRWLLEYYPHIDKNLKPIEIVQKPGDIIFVPSAWWHQVLNLTDTVCVTQNIANQYNITDVLKDVNKLHPKWESDFKAAIKEQHPEHHSTVA